MRPWNSLPFNIQNHSRALVVVAMVCTFLFFWKYIIHDALPTIPEVKETFYKKPKPLDSIANRTLGVCHGLVLNPPHFFDELA